MTDDRILNPEEDQGFGPGDTCDEITELREQLRRKDTALDEWIAAYYHNTAQIRGLTDALRGAKEDRDLCARRMKAIETAHRRRLAHFLAEGESDD